MAVRVCYGPPKTTKAHLFKIILIGVIKLIKTSLGVNAHIPATQLLEKVFEAGLKWIRLDMNWTHFEGKEKNQLYWKDFDRITSYCDRRGINILGILAYTPNWANNNKGIGEPPTDIHDWIDFIFHVTKRYKDVVRYWEIWNEPNLPAYFYGGQKTYGEQFLATASVAIREVDPHARIVAPALSVDHWSWLDWMNMMEWAAKHNFFDILSIHTYHVSGHHLINAFKWVFNYLTYRIKKPMWLTETGWDSHRVSEKTQKTYYEEFIGYLPYSNLEKVFFYELIDDPATDWEYGILRQDLSHKPVYNYLKDI